MQIAAIDEDITQDGIKIPLSFISKDVLSKQYAMNTNASNTGGYPNMSLKTTVDNFYNNIPVNVRERIQTVYKSYLVDGTTKWTNMKIFIPSVREIRREKENSGVDYVNLFSSGSNRIGDAQTTIRVWTRTTPDTYNNAVHVIQSNNRQLTPLGADRCRVTNAYNVSIGFCLGLEPETITDSWDTIFANTNPSATYSIGDTKSISINGEKHLMQIVGFNTDDMTVGGKAKISWLMKDQLTVPHSMTVADTDENSWPATEMRSWLRDTILSTIDSSIRNYIVDVNKTYYDYTDKITKTSSDNIWLASAREIFGGTSYESSGCDYTTLFNTQASRIKKRSGDARDWWLRSKYFKYSGVFCIVRNNGSSSTFVADHALGVCIGFCTN